MTHWDAIRIINEAPWSSTVKNLARALLQWRDSKTGLVRPRVLTIAQALSVSESTARTYLNEALACGALAIAGPRSGGRQATSYRLILPESTPPDSGGMASASPPKSGAQPAGLRHSTHRIPSPNPPDSGPDPTKNRPRNQPQQPPAVVVGDVFDRLGIPNLRGHANATPERMTWIEADAPSKDHPGGWAAQCIREGWTPPPPTPAQAEAARKERRAAQLTRFDSLPEADRAAVLARVRRQYDNLSNRSDDDPVFRSAVALFMDHPTSKTPAIARESTNQWFKPNGHGTSGSGVPQSHRRTCWPACTIRSTVVPCRDGERDSDTSGGLGALRADPLRGEQGDRHP